MSQPATQRFMGTRPNWKAGPDAMKSIRMGWLQGHYLDEHEAPVVDFTKLSVESVSLANRCKARPDENLFAAADRVFGK
jgi:hypothetical protein